VQRICCCRTAGWIAPMPPNISLEPPDAAHLVGARQRTTSVHRWWSRLSLLRGCRGRNMTCSGNPAHLNQRLPEKVRQALAGAGRMPVPRACDLPVPRGVR
jgi:hypothetical protein